MARQGKAATANKGNPAGDGELNKHLPPVADAMTGPGADEDPYDSFEENFEAESSAGPAAAIVETAAAPEFEVPKEMGAEGLGAAGTAAVTFAERFRQVADESTACAKEILNSGYAFAGEIRQAKSPVAAAELQIDYTRSVYIRLLDHFVKLSEFYWHALRHACTSPGKKTIKANC
ncbi:MAG: phasin family protein [Methylocapsa sp.]|nr:phasin family protein [Methylocapsa sp.]